jgi:hypothetical protein
MNLFFKLDKDKNVIPAKDCMDWATAFENLEGRVVKQEDVGKYSISTVFFGTNLNLHEGSIPLVFETMIFENGTEIYCDRYPTWNMAVKGHERAKRKVTEKIKRETK